MGVELGRAQHGSPDTAEAGELLLDLLEREGAEDRVELVDEGGTFLVAIGGAVLRGVGD